MNMEELFRQIVREELARFFKQEPVGPMQKATPSIKDYCTKAELVKMLGDPHPTTLWRWEKKGMLGKPVVMGMKKMYKLSEIILLQK